MRPLISVPAVAKRLPWRLPAEVSKKAFFVTDRDLIRFKVADKVIEVFEKNSIPYEFFSDVKANPTITNVQNGVAAFKASGADFIVALGGGSSIDTAKGIGIVVNNPDFADVKSLEGVADTRQKGCPYFLLYLLRRELLLR